MKPNRILPSLLVATALVVTGLATHGCNSGPSGGPSNGGPNASNPVKLSGAGSSFVNPAMSSWKYAYHDAHANVDINYASVGSGAGIAQYQAGTVDFGATDAPLTDK